MSKFLCIILGIVAMVNMSPASNRYHINFLVNVNLSYSLNLGFMMNGTPPCYFEHTYNGSIKDDPYAAITFLEQVKSSDIVSYTYGTLDFQILENRRISKGSEIGFSINVLCTTPPPYILMNYDLIKTNNQSVYVGIVKAVSDCYTPTLMALLLGIIAML